MARTIIPIAEIAVRVLRTAGRARYIDALSTTVMRNEYQDTETHICTHASRSIPQASEKLFGTN